LSNLRKSLASQRPASPNQSQKSPPPPRAHKLTLEDRLRAAAFTIGETSNETTPAASSRVSPSLVPPPVDNPLDAPGTTTEPEPTTQPMSPSSMPLPESRISSPIQLHEPSPVIVAPPPPEPVVPASPKPQIPPVDQVLALEAEVALPPDEGSRVTDVDALQERLKLVEQRFSGG
jgi:hypothetical protein